MTMELREFVLQARIDANVLSQWIEAGWLAPHRIDTAQHFSEVDLARAHLVHDLQQLGVNDEGISVILDLVDQLHGVRRVLREILSGIDAQPESARHQLLAGLHQAMSGRASDVCGQTQTRDRQASQSS
jgi:chaperone modulatory protein CbpM